MRVAIVAMGPTSSEYFEEVYYTVKKEDFNQQSFNAISGALKLNNLPMDDKVLHKVLETCEAVGEAATIPKRHDQVWAINGMGMLLQHTDKIFAMDDLARPHAPNMPKDRVITTCHERAEYMTELYPIQEVLDEFGSVYFNNTIAYAIAYAILKNVSHISLYGCDFTPHNGTDARKSDAGASCCEYWLREAERRGISYYIPKGTRLMGRNTDEALYGYTTQPVLRVGDNIMYHKNGRWNFEYQPIERNVEQNEGEEATEVYEPTVRSHETTEQD